MIASFFKKSTPLNYALVVFLMLFSFCIYQIQDTAWVNSTILKIQRMVVFLVLLASVFLISFIAKRNGLTKDSTYTAFLYFLFLLFFPTLFDNFDLVFANFFIVLALRRLISLQSIKSVKEKIFDASLWIFVASLFHFWCIIFLPLVFFSIRIHAFTDYRKRLLPFIAFFVVAILFMVFALIYQINIEDHLYQSSLTYYQLDYFVNNQQNAAFSVYVSIALFFVFSMLITMSDRPSNNHISYKKILASFVIGVAVFLISAQKSNDLLVFTIAPLATLGAAHIEQPQPQIRRDIVLAIFIVCSVLLFWVQL
jgi:hypothetical protein